MRISDTYDIKNLMFPADLELLCDSVGQIEAKDKSVVNVGTYYGASAAALLVGMHLYDVTGTLFVVDVFKYHNAGAPGVVPFRERDDVSWSDPFLDEVKSTLAPFIGDKIVKYWVAFSDDVNLQDVGEISLVFLDGDHTTHGCLLDALKYSQKVVIGGRLLFHDYTNFESVRQAVDMLLQIRPTFEMGSIREGSSIATVRKR